MQKESRTRGNSLFVDDSFVPYPDQWAFLASVRKIGLLQAEEIVRQAESQGGVIGVRLAPTDEEDDRAPWSLSPSRRRKDRLLQENGYFVLRFLAGDIGCNLDEVLDSILRVLVNRQRLFS